MRILWLILLFVGHGNVNETNLVISQKVITVQGQTSIGKFRCNFSKNGLKDTLFINRTGKQNELIFEIPVQEFSCGNFILNSDFRKTIKANEYPQAKVKVTNLKAKGNNYICDLYVELVGKHLEYKDFQLKNIENSLKGELNIRFDILDLETPRKLGGLVKVEDELRLEIELKRQI